MAITNATRLSDFATGIGTQGAIIQVDNTNARLGIGTTSPTAMFSVGPNANIIMDGIAGVITATSIAASATGLTGTPSVTVNLVSATDVNVSGSATIDGHLSVAGTITHEDVTNVDSVGIVTGRLGVRVLSGGIQVVGLTTGLSASGVSTFASDVRVSGNINSAGIATFSGGSAFGAADITVAGTSGVSSVTWDASADSLIFKDKSYAKFGDGSDLSIYHDGSINFIQGANSANLYACADDFAVLNQAANKTAIWCNSGTSVELYYDNAKKFETTTAGAYVTGIGTISGELSAVGGADFSAMLKEDINIVADELRNGTNVDLENGMVHLYTSAEQQSSTPNIRYNGSTTLASKMAVGETITVTVITTTTSTSYFCANLAIDSSAVTEEWLGGSAPAAGSGSGYDVYTYNIIKTAATPTYVVLANFSNFA